MSPKPQVERPEYVDRASKIRELCQGVPVSIEKVEAQFNDDDLRMFQVSSPKHLFDLIKIAADTLLAGPDTDAIRNALGIGFNTSDNLTERRAKLLERVDITMRALQSREIKGAELLVRQMEVLLTQRSDLLSEADINELAIEVYGLKNMLQEIDVRLGVVTRTPSEDEQKLFSMETVNAMRAKQKVHYDNWAESTMVDGKVVFVDPKPMRTALEVIIMNLFSTHKLRRMGNQGVEVREYFLKLRSLSYDKVPEDIWETGGWVGIENFIRGYSGADLLAKAQIELFGRELDG